MPSVSVNDRWIRLVSVPMEAPSLRDNTADGDRFIKGLEKALMAKKIDLGLPLLKKMPSLLREHGYKLWSAVFKGFHAWEVIELVPPSSEGLIYGLALDLGSSTLVVRLLDLASGEIRDETGASH